MMDAATPHHPDELRDIEQVLAHFGQLEAQLQEVREALAHSHRLATMGTITSVIAHEFNNILTPMISYTQLALARPEDAAMNRKALEKALAGAERAAKISASLLGFAREADEQHVARVPQVVEEAVGCLGRPPERDRIELTVEVEDIVAAMPPVNLQQVLVNLLLNARQALARQGGAMSVAATQRGQLVEITVSDTGPGIPEAIRDRLFEPFVTSRADDSGARQGTGLGLSICRDLVHQAGGTIRFETSPDEGTRFHITLPVADELLIDLDDAVDGESSASSA